VVNDSADVTSSGMPFHVCGPATGKARLPTVDSLLVGTTRRLMPTERSDRRLGRSATRVKGPRYPGASPWTTYSCCFDVSRSTVDQDMRKKKQFLHVHSQ